MFSCRNIFIILVKHPLDVRKRVHKIYTLLAYYDAPPTLPRPGSVVGPATVALRDFPCIGGPLGLRQSLF